jgi:DNA helicase HerA-like ATPase
LILLRKFKITPFSTEDKPIKIGQLEFDDGVDISLGINKLFASHIGIFGNTGSGKSYTLAKIYRQLFKKYKKNENFKNNATFIIIDFNGVFSVASKNIDQKAAFSIVDFEIGSFSLSLSSSIALVVKS